MAKSDDSKYIEDFLRGVVQICQNIDRGEIKKFTDYVFRAWKRKSTIFFIGNGGSAGTASHFAADLNNAATKIPRAYPIKAISLVDNISRFSALVNDMGWGNVYVEQLKNYFKPGDIVIGISVHGGAGRDRAGAWSQNLLKALQYAKDNRGKALGLTGFDGGAMKDICDACIVVPYNTTPHVEGFHVVVHHLVFDLLTRKIEANYKK